MRHVLSISEFQRFLARMSPEVERAIIRGLRGGAMRLHRAVVEEIDHATPYPAVDTGELRNSVDTERTDTGAIVDVKAPHAAVMEHGARPFTPPLKPLMEWVRRKGFARPQSTGQRRDSRGRFSREFEREWLREERETVAIALAIQRTIAKRGIAPRHYFRKAVTRTTPEIRAEVDRELAALSYGRVRRGRRA